MRTVNDHLRNIFLSGELSEEGTGHYSVTYQAQPNYRQTESVSYTHLFVLFFSYLSWRRDSSRREYSFGGALDETTISPRDHILTNQ